MTTTTVRPWTLAKFRQTILDCYLEKLRMDSDNTDNTVTQLTPFVCTFFFNKYGVKRLVQVCQASAEQRYETPLRVTLTPRHV